MKSSFEHDGIWWLPDDPERSVAGTLSYNPTEGLRLKLVGAFGSLTDLQNDHSPPIILGMTVAGKVVTLFESVRSSVRITMPGFPSSAYVSRVAFYGHHFASDEQLLFRTVSLTYPHLMDWAGVTGFSSHQEHEADGRLRRLSTEYSFPDRYTTDVPWGTLSFDYTIRQEGDHTNSLGLFQDTRLKLEFSEQVPFSELWHKYRYHIENFLTFALGTEIRPLAVFLTADGATDQTTRGPVVKTIEVFASSRDAEMSSKTRHPHEMLFHLDDLDGQLGPTMAAWFEKAELLGPVYDLYFGLRYGRQVYLQFQLLGVAQALEVFHRRTSEGSYLPPTDFEVLRDRLTGCLPDDLPLPVRDAFRAKVGYMNELSLRARLRQLLGAYPELVDVGIPDPSRFVRQMTDTRNYLTHYSSELATSAVEGETLYLLVRQAMFLLEVYLMLQLDMTPARALEIAQRNNRYQLLRHRVASTLPGA